MGTMLMDSENVYGAGGQVQGHGETFGEQTTSFYNGVASITAEDCWSGEDDSVEFNNVAESMRNDLATAKQIIDEVGADLQVTADTFDETVAANKATISQI